MEINMDYKSAREMLLAAASAVDTERVALEQAGGRILAYDLKASENVPAFDRSPYDGYAFRAKDSIGASEKKPVTLKILEEIPAGSVPTKEITEGTAAKVLTGAPVPDGADAVIMYENTSFTQETVTLYSECSSGDNIIFAGEDVKKGSILARAGSMIDPGLMGTLASQGIFYPEVYRKPVVGIISTGSELIDMGTDKKDEFIPPALPKGKIINSNRYTLTAALERDGCNPVYLGTAEDTVEQISELIQKGLSLKPCKCDMIILTGGVSAGDYDLTPEAMERSGCQLFNRGVKLKPGMACCYGIKEGKLICALSGNPSSSLTNYYAVVRPSVRKITGIRDYMPETVTVILENGFRKKSKVPRILKGRLKIAPDGRALLHIPRDQGNVMISSSIGCDCMAEVPAGSSGLEPGTKLQAFLV